MVTSGGFVVMLWVKVVSVLELAMVAYSVCVGVGLHAIRASDDCCESGVLNPGCVRGKIGA